MDNIGFSILLVVVGLFLGVLIILLMNKLRILNSGKEADKLIERATKEAEKLKRDKIIELKEESYKLKQDTDNEIKEKKKEIQDLKNLVESRENSLNKRDELLQEREKNLDLRDKDLLAKQKEIQEKDAKMESILKEQIELLERISGFSKEKARDLVMKKVEEDMSKEIAIYLRERENDAKLEADRKAKEYLVELEYQVTYYEVKKSYEHDFLIKIGIKNKTIEQITPVLETLFESITKEKITVEQVKEENTTIYVHILPEIKMDVIYAYGNMPTENELVSGDNYCVKELDNGHILFAISDGMGKGYSAFYESDMTLKFVEDIVELNIEPSTALTILNTFYVVQDYLERYATLDFLDINRHTGLATFYKMGANTTYIFRHDGSIDKIINKSLPLGIDEEVDQKTYQLEDDDLIIMSSDGVIENLIDDQKMETFIQDARVLSPQQLIYEILNYTIKNQIKTKDDMTIIALKIKNRNQKNK